MFDWVGWIILYVVSEWFGHRTGRLVLGILTLGTVKADRLLANEAPYGWLGFRRMEGGRIIAASETVTWIGLLFWIAILFVAVLVREW